MKRLFVHLVVFFCMSSVVFAASTKKKKVASSPEVTFDVDSCVDKAIDYRTLLTTNPYDNVGKCYYLGFPMANLKLISKSVALIGFADGQYKVFALIDYGKESVPMEPFNALVMGRGAFEYPTNYGTNIVHRLKVLDGVLRRTKKQQQEKDLRDKKAAEERAKLDLIKDAERQKAAALAREELRIYDEKARISREENERLTKFKEDQTRWRQEREEQSRIEKERILDLKFKKSGLEINGDMLTDKNSGLMWVKSKHKTYPKSPNLNGLQIGGFSDWTIPTVAELKTLSRYGADLLKAAGLETNDVCYLSSNITKESAYYHCVYLDSGSMGKSIIDDVADVLPVRGGGFSNWINNVVQ